LWWAFDASPDSSLPTATFDEPLEWPDALPWEEFDAGEARADGFPDPEHLSFDLLFPPADGPAPAEAEAEADAGGRPATDRPETAPPGGDPTELHLESLPDSIWAPDAPGDEPPRLVTITGSISADEGPPLYAEAERSGSGGGRWRRWLTVPRGNAAVVALICFASLVLLGMFLSVRARNELTTETSRTPTTQTTVAATRPLNTVALNPATSVAPPGSIALSDLVPPPDTAAQADGGSSPAGTTPRAAATTTTAPRSTAPAATQPTTATTAATPPPVDNPPPVTSPPPDDTTQTTRRTTPSSIDFPRTTYTLPSTSIPRPSITWPTGSNNN
jgi:hypothetical protein